MRLKPSAARQDGATPTPSGDQPTVYRALGSLISGGLMVVFGLIGVFAFSLGSETHPLGATVGLLMAVMGFIGGLYPVAESHADRVVIRNPFRYIEVPWPRVEEVSAKLSLVVETKPGDGDGDGDGDGTGTGSGAGSGSGKSQKFTVWSVPVSMHERRKADRTVAKQARAARQDAFKSAQQTGNTEALLHGGRGAGAMRGPQGVSMIETMAFADQAVAEMNDRRSACSTKVAEAAPTKVTWTWWTLGGFAVSVGLVVVAALGAF
jgi:hypothetical protein